MINIHQLVRRMLLPVLVGSCALSAAHATTDFPKRPISIVVPYAAGSPTDVVARAFASDFSTLLKTPVVVENRPGANQTIAASYVARAEPDGYTLLFPVIPAVVPPSLRQQLPYKSYSDFSAVGNVMTNGYILAVAPEIPANNLQEFIALLRANPGKYSYGSSGVASALHLMGEMFNKAAGVDAIHVPYKGANQVQLDLMSNRISYAFLTINAMDYVRDGRIKTFGIASDHRDADYPELPTLEEGGLKHFKVWVSFYLAAPKATPRDVVLKLNAAANAAIVKPEMYEKLKALGGITMMKPASPEQIDKEIADEARTWDQLVKEADIQLE